MSHTFEHRRTDECVRCVTDKKDAQRQQERDSRQLQATKNIRGRIYDIQEHRKLEEGYTTYAI